MLTAEFIVALPFVDWKHSRHVIRQMDQVKVLSTTLRHTVRSDDIDTGSAVTVEALQIQLGWSRLAIAQNLDVTIVSGYA